MDLSNKNFEESKYFKEISKLLLTGATMMAESCPDCNVPLFKKKDKIFCPKCKKQAIYTSTENEAKEIEQKYSFSETQATLQDILTGKMNFLAQKIASSEDIPEIREILNLIKEIIEVLQNLRNLT